MKNIGIIILFATSLNINAQDFILCEAEGITPSEEFNLCNTNPYVLVFEDNFNGDELDLSEWEFGSRIRICNDEQQYYTHGDNIEFSDGKIHIVAKEETIEDALVLDGKPPTLRMECDGVDRGLNERDFYFTSENIQTIKKFSYGYYEAKVRIPKGKGFWPAFWLYTGDPKYNEIDIFEFWNEKSGNYDPDLLSRIHHMNIHHDHDGDGNRSRCGDKYKDDDFSTSDHVFALVWEPNKIEWYVDNDLKLASYKYSNILDQPYECTVPAFQTALENIIFPSDPMNIIFNFAIQSGTDAPDSQSVFPSQMSVDWVRYYKKSSVEDITISNSSQLTLDDEIFNDLIGDNIEIDCNYTISSTQQLEIIAASSVTIESGFAAELGSALNIRVD